MILLGLDASSSSTGWAVFDNKGLAAYGIIKPNGEDWRDRLVHQGSKLKEIMEKYHPDKIVMEDVTSVGYYSFEHCNNAYSTLFLDT